MVADARISLCLRLGLLLHQKMRWKKTQSQVYVITAKNCSPELDTPPGRWKTEAGYSQLGSSSGAESSLNGSFDAENYNLGTYLE